MITLVDLSSYQIALLKKLAKSNTTQLAGYGQAKWLSVARALKRRGLADSFYTGTYFITKAGEELLKELEQ